MPSLKIARSECSAVILNDWLYVLGGITKIDERKTLHPTDTIERLNMNSLVNGNTSLAKKEFQVMRVRLPTSCINLGVQPLSQSECLILGGFKEKNLNQILRLSSFNGSQSAEELKIEFLNKTLPDGDFF